jgi:hypothetical protein
MMKLAEIKPRREGNRHLLDENDLPRSDVSAENELPRDFHPEEASSFLRRLFQQNRYIRFVLI